MIFHFINKKHILTSRQCLYWIRYVLDSGIIGCLIDTSPVFIFTLDMEYHYCYSREFHVCIQTTIQYVHVVHNICKTIFLLIFMSRSILSKILTFGTSRYSLPEVSETNWKFKKEKFSILTQVSASTSLLFGSMRVI